jgi:transposase
MTMTTESVTTRSHNGGVSQPEDPAPRPKRRSFTAEYKARILAEHDALPEKSSERGALVRREGLYSSHIAEWRNAAARAALGGLEPKTRQPKRSPAERELERATARISKLEAELARTRLALEITGKAHALLEMLSESAATDKKWKP